MYIVVRKDNIYGKNLRKLSYQEHINIISFELIMYCISLYRNKEIQNFVAIVFYLIHIKY